MRRNRRLMGKRKNKYPNIKIATKGFSDLSTATEQQRDQVDEICARQFKILDLVCPTDKIKLMVTLATLEFLPPPEELACKKGCSNCCHQRVAVSEAEVDLILNYCQDHNIEIDKIHLGNQLNKLASDYHFDKMSACVFLSQKGECKIYPARPLVCRLMMVPSEEDPENCKPENQTVMLIDGAAEAAVTAYWKSTRGKIGTLPQILLSKLR
jgi:Fe-S-cluster containining protein